MRAYISFNLFVISKQNCVSNCCPVCVHDTACVRMLWKLSECVVLDQSTTCVHV